MWVRSLRLGHTNFQPYRSTDKRQTMLTIYYFVKRLVNARTRREENRFLVSCARERQWAKNHERMHWMSVVTKTAYTSSELYDNLYKGAPEYA